MMEIEPLTIPLTDCGFMDFIRYTYPVSFIGIVLATFGYGLSAAVYIPYIKSLERQLERCH